MSWLGLLLCVLGAAEAAQVLLQADSQKLTVGQAVQMHLTVVDAKPDEPPVLPQVEGLEIVSLGRPAYSRQSRNLQTTTTLTYSFQVTATLPGDHALAAVPVQVDGETLYSKPLRFTVSEQPGSGAESLVATISDEDGQLWVGQALVYSLQFMTSRRMVDRRWTPPTFEGMVTPPDVQRGLREYQTAIEGQAHLVVEVEEPLVVTSAGRRNIAPSVFTVQYPVQSARRQPMGFPGMGFTETQTQLFTSEAIELEVLPLPDEGRDEQAWSGLVGRFVAVAALSSESVAVGESSTMVVTVTGEGNLSGFTLPPLELDGLRAYDDTSELVTGVQDGQLVGQAVFRRALVPETAGTVELPALRVQVFDPVEGAYVWLETGPLRLEVTEGEGQAQVETFTDAPAAQRRDVQSLGQDLLPIHAQARLSDQTFSPAVLGLAGLPWLAFLGLVVRQRLARPGPEASHRERLARDLEALDPTDLAGLERAFRDALAIALDRPAAGLTRDDLAGLDQGLRDRAEQLYLDLERARYGGGGAALTQDVRALCQELVA